LELIWQTAGHPVRAGLRTWQPYEQLPWPIQEAMLHAAAAALQLAADGRITARGVLGSAIQPSALNRVYEADPPSPFRTAWIDFAAAAQEALDQARTHPDGARRLLALLTMSSRTREAQEREIGFLRDNGVPAGFLPGAAELDRLFPVSTPGTTGQPVTTAGRR
jgi:hypothetical protein